jgi:putative membrane protein
MSILSSWAVLTAAVLATAAVLPGFRIRGVGSAILVAALFGVLNVLLGWLLFVAIGLGTLGLGFLFAFLTRWLVDAILLRIIDAMTTRLWIAGFGTAFLAAMIMSGLGTLLELLIARA